MATVLESNTISTNPQIIPQRQTQVTQICISGKECGRQFCICDLANIRTRGQNYIDVSQIICKDCFNGLEASYEHFARRIRSLRSDFFQEYLAVKVASLLQNIRSNLDSSGCECARDDCNITKLTAYQRDDLNNKFNAIYAAFSFSTRPTDTRHECLRWLGRNNN